MVERLGQQFVHPSASQVGTTQTAEYVGSMNIGLVALVVKFLFKEVF